MADPTPETVAVDVAFHPRVKPEGTPGAATLPATPHIAQAQIVAFVRAGAGFTGTLGLRVHDLFDLQLSRGEARRLAAALTEIADALDDWERERPESWAEGVAREVSEETGKDFAR